MKKRILLLTSAFLLLFSFVKGQSCPLGVSGTFTVGPSGNYTTLQAALDDLHTKGVSGKVLLELQSGYAASAESYPIVARAIPCAGSGQGLTIRPAAGAAGAPVTISSNDSNATIDLNNASYITIDGRAGGTGTALSLIVNNTNTSGSAVRMINGASHNRIAFLDLHGVTTYAGRGVVTIANSNTATGNCYNRIDSCSVSNGLTDPIVGIAASAPTTLMYNVGNSITGCKIFNFWGKWPDVGSGVSLAPGNDSASIVGNSLYQTKNRDTTLPDYTGHYQVTVISASSCAAVNVSGNYIGGTAPLNGGAILKMSSIKSFIGINVANGLFYGTGAAVVNDNMIANLSLKDANGQYTMIQLIPYCGVCKNNTIGGLGAFNLLTATATDGLNFTGIDVVSLRQDSAATSGNHISGISVTAPNNAGVIGINVNSSSNYYSHCLVENNTIGNGEAGGIQVTGRGFMDGIRVNTENANTYFGPPSNIVVRGNTVSGTGSTACLMRGIHAYGNVVGRVDITGNNILRLDAGDGAFVTPSPVDIRGIFIDLDEVYANNGTLNCADNKIYDLLANASQNDQMSGIYAGNLSKPGNGLALRISRNLIKQLFLSGKPGNYDFSQVAGMIVDIGVGTDSLVADNNIIQLGFTEGSEPPPVPYFGIRHFSGAATYLHNTIFIEGQVGWKDSRTGVIFSTCFNRVDSSWCKLKNNIFALTRTYLADSTSPHFCIMELTSYKNFTSDFNLYYGLQKTLTGLVSSPYYPQGYQYIQGAYPPSYATLADWQAGTGWDKHSLSADPLLTDPDRDLQTPPRGVHVSQHTPAEAVGDSTATTLTDFSGQLRAGLTPVDIGADAGNFNGAPVPPPPPVDTTHSDTTRTDTTSRPRDSVSLATPAPNPFTGILNVHVNADQPGTVDVSIFYYSGKLLIEKKAPVVKGDNLVPVDMSAYPDGSYILKVELGGRRQTSVILKKTN